jgi:predicted outer membrane lipoprotein
MRSLFDLFVEWRVILGVEIAIAFAMISAFPFMKLYERENCRR